MGNNFLKNLQERFSFGDRLRPKDATSGANDTFIIAPERRKIRAGVAAILALAGAACRELSLIEPGGKIACTDNQAGCASVDAGVDAGPDGGPLDANMQFDGGNLDGGEIGPDGGPQPGLCGSNAECDDNFACTRDERCAPHAEGHDERGCLPGTPVNANDGVACTTDSCDPAVGIQHNPNHAACVQTTCLTGECLADEGCVGIPAPDGIQCANNDGKEGICRDGICSVTCETDQECDDGKTCTQDACAEDKNCKHYPTQSVCDDRQFCNGVEVCNPDSPGANHETGCAAAEITPTCDDDVRCTDDQCDETADECVNTPNAADHCDDGNMCNGAEICDPVEDCKSANIETDCSSLTDQCKIGRCDPRTGECFTDNRTAGVLCDDNNICTGIAHCLDGSCIPGMPADCSDDDPCTADNCLPAIGCNNVPVDCSNMAGELTECQTASCNPDTGACQVDSLPNGTPCTDDRFCRVNQECFNGSCDMGDLRNCQDDIPCTLDTCSEAENSCIHNPQHETCQNDFFCDGSEVCSETEGCIRGITPECPDVTCNVGFCSPVSDDCELSPVLNGTACEDEDACTTSDICQTGTCIGGPSPLEIPGDGLDNDCDEWTDESTGVDVRCETGAIVMIEGVTHACVERELLQVPGGASFTASLVAHRTDPDRVFSAQATLQTLVPPGYGNFVRVVARRGADGDSNSQLHCGDMPPPPPGKQPLCYNAPVPAVARDGEIVTFDVTTRP